MSNIGIFNLTAADQKQLDALVRQTGLSGEKRDHELMGQNLAEPIRQVADYMSWTHHFFTPQAIGPAEDNRIPLDEYTVVAFYSSPTGQVMYTRPGRKYHRPDFTMIDCGLEIGWDTMAEAGWNILARKQIEAAEELARKRDALALTVLNASITASGNTTATAAGGNMTRTGVDTVFKTMAAAGWEIRTVVGNTGDLMDMAGWTTTDNLWLWPDELTRTLVTQFYWNKYGNAIWYGYSSVPASTVWFAVEPSKLGYHQTKGEIRTASDINITKKVNLYTWDEKDAYTIDNDYGLYTLTITA